MSQGCGEQVAHWGSPVQCGKFIYGGAVLCDDCTEKYREQYPQGWRYYPGDLCPHGVYTGGCGVDWMCGRCESGEDELMEDYLFEEEDDVVEFTLPCPMCGNPVPAIEGSVSAVLCHRCYTELVCC